jgi:hypothetical protein
MCRNHPFDALSKAVQYQIAYLTQMYATPVELLAGLKTAA